MILDRYVFRLWLGPFLGGLALVCGVLLLGRALRYLPLVAESGAPWAMLGQMMVFVLPYFSLLTVPIAFFLSMQNVVAGLQQNSEMDALRGAGLSYARIFRSLILTAAALYLGLAWVAMDGLPKGQLALNNVLNEIYHLKGAPEFTPRRFSREVDKITFYVEGKDKQGRYHGVMVSDNRAGGPVFYVAEMAELAPAAGGVRLRMWNGTRLEGRGGKQRVLAFRNYDVEMPIAGLGAVKALRSTDHVILMTPSELWHQLQANPTPEARAEWHRRLILPTTVLVLCLFALPLSLAPKRAGRMGSLLMGIGLLVLLYNSQLVLHRQVELGVLPPLAMWAGQAALLLGGLWLWRRAEMGALPGWLSSGGEWFYLIHQRVTHWLSMRRGSRARGGS